MQRYQVLVTVGGILLVALLFSLPRSVVKNPDKTLAQESQDTQRRATQTPALHLPEIPPARQTELSLLRRSLLQNLSGKEAPKILASIMSLFRELSLFDSAAYYAGLYADKAETSEAYSEAGNAYFEAFSLALKDEHVSYLAEKTRYYLQKAVELNPKNYDARVKIGVTYVSGNQPMQGIMMIRKVLEEDPKNTLAILNLGVFAMQSNQHDKAIERFRQLVEIEPQNAQSYLYLGAALAQAGQKAEAKIQLRKALELGKGTQIETTAKDYLESLN